MDQFLSGAALHLFDELDSTSAEAKRQAGAGARGPAWFVARRQTAGYGRRARPWRQREGDFAGTLLFSPSAADNLPQLSFVAGLAVAAALDNWVPSDALALKWPNDILLSGGKCAGLLLEQTGARDDPALALGVGVNIVSAPGDLPYRTARLADYSSAPLKPTALAAAIDEAFWPRLAQWRANGFAPIRRAWLARAHGLGAAMTVRLPNETLRGVFDGVDANGALMLRIGAEKRIISAGDIHFEEDAP